MNPILQGSLRHFTVADVLTLLAQRMQSGTIDFENEGKRTRVVMRDGKIAGAVGPDAVAAVGSACYWTDGTFSLVQELTLGEGIVPTDYEVGALLDEVARRAAAEKAEAERYNDNVTFRVIDNPDAQEKLDPSADELKLLIRIGLGRKIADLIGSRDRKEFIKTLKRLESGGVIERVEGEKGEEPWKAEPEPPKKEPKPAQAPAAARPAEARPAPQPPAKKEEPPSPKSKAEPKSEPKPEPKPESQPAPKPEPKAEAKAEAKPEAKAEPKPEPAPKPKPSDDATQMLRPERTRTGRGLMASLTSDTGDAFPLLDDEVVIGRAPTNTISLNDGSISTRHARITRTPDGFFIEDLKSRNGTFVNGDQVTERRPLADNDTIRLGKVIFTFNVATELQAGDTTAGVK